MVIATSALLMACAAEELDNEKWQRKRAKRVVWVKEWLARRETLGAYHTLVLEP